MLTPRWQLKTPLDAVIFDCDGTLSRIEGIDELAAINDAATAVKNLTAIAMGNKGINPDLYRERLLLTQPRLEQMRLIAEKYIQTLSEDIEAVVAVYQRLQKPVFIVSAGLLPAILPLAHYLHVPDHCVFAVDIQFDAQGKFLDFDRQSPLIGNQGKYTIVRKIVEAHPRTAFVGDGLNDLAAKPLVTRFIGYGGAFYRGNIASQSEYYIKVPSVSPLLPLTLTPEEQLSLHADETALLLKGQQILIAAGVNIQEKKPS